jgi:hypothetical protein
MVGMGITTRRTGTPVKFDGAKAAKLIAGFVPGAILRRTDKGIDAKGNAFALYRPGYRNTLAAMGEDGKVDLRLTGGLLNSIKARSIETTADGVRVTIAPDTGTSPEVRAPSETRALRRAGLVEGRFGEKAVYKTLRRGEARRLDRDLEFEGRGKRMIRTGKRGPPHNVLGYWLHHGTPTMQARPFMGLTPEQQRELYQILAKAKIFG